MDIISSQFKNREIIPAKYSCDGEDVNPPLSFVNVPDDAESLALIMEDPDAQGGAWVHWTIWNITPEIAELNENEIPPGAVEGLNSSGSNGYEGPCPPTGTHRYIFKLYALDSTLTLSEDADRDALEEAMERHIIEKAELIGLYTSPEIETL